MEPTAKPQEPSASVTIDVFPTEQANQWNLNIKSTEADLIKQLFILRQAEDGIINRILQIKRYELEGPKPSEPSRILLPA